MSEDQAARRSQNKLAPLPIALWAAQPAHEPSSPCFARQYESAKSNLTQSPPILKHNRLDMQQVFES